MVSEKCGITGEVCVVLENEGPHSKSCAWKPGLKPQVCDCGKFQVEITHNLITNDGDAYYASAAKLGITGTGSLTYTFNDMSVVTAYATPFGTKSADFDDLTTIPSQGTQDIDTGYPVVNDSDTNNPGTVGTDILTWKCTYGSAEAVGTLLGCAIHESGATTGSKILMSAAFSSSIGKASGQSLAVYVNHTFNGYTP